jgi:LPXTG-motif cell wall-anchored protein
VSSTGYVAGTGVGAAATNGGNGEVVVEAVLPANLSTSITQTHTMPVAEGTVFTTQVVTINQGPAAATGLVTRVTFPVGLTPTSANGTGNDCHIFGQVITCKAPTLPNATINTITVTSDWTGQESGGTLTTSATATSSTPDPDATNNTATVSFDEPAVTTPPPTVSGRPAASPPETLAATGTAPIDTPITAAAGLIFAGLALLFARRSRRNRSHPQE